MSAPARRASARPARCPAPWPAAGADPRARPALAPEPSLQTQPLSAHIIVLSVSHFDMMGYMTLHVHNSHM